LNVDLVIKSPGIPDKAPIIKKLKSLKVEIIDEIEFGFRQLKIKNPNTKVVAITGSNGKTTTTSLIYHLFEKASLNVAVGGNIGQSFAKQVALNDFDFYVLEVSSFQLDYCFDFQPNVAILLNISPDHLDRYEYKLSNYVDSKFRIAQSLGVKDVFIFNNENELMTNWLSANEITTQKVSINNENYQSEYIKIDESQFAKSDLTIKGPHNYFNASCAIVAAKSCGITDEQILEGLKTFQAVPHRLETIATINGVEYINDSKATNVDAVKFALLAMDKPVIWIVGGVDKGNDYSEIMPLVKEKVKAMICLGVDNSKLKEEFLWLYFSERSVQTAADAVRIASHTAQSWDAVLLSPACASFDLFRNYVHRGELFRKAVEELDVIY